MGRCLICNRPETSADLKTAYAIITVDYPEGSSCICSNGIKTMEARNSYGAWAFAVPYDGVWTVTASFDGKTASKEVAITGKGQAKSVSLTYEWYFFREGEGLGDNLAKRLSGTLTYDSNSIKLVSGESGTYSMIISPEIPNIKEYKTLRVAANVGNGYGTCEFGLCNNPSATYAELRAGTYVIARLAPSAKNARDIYNIDLASVAASETRAYFYTLCPNGAHTTYFYDIVALP